MRFRAPRVASAFSSARLRSEEHTSELQSLRHLVCRLLLEKKKYANKSVVSTFRLFLPRLVSAQTTLVPLRSVYKTCCRLSILFYCVSFFFFLMKRRPPKSTLFPYPTLFQ